MSGSVALRYVKTIAGLLLRRPLVSVSVVPVAEDGRIALARRRDNGRWSLPGGLVDWGEALADCAARELAEEIGLELRSIDRVVGVYSAPDRDPKVHSISVAVAASVIGEPRAVDRAEILDARLMGYAEIEAEIGLDALSHDHGKHLRDYRAGLPPRLE